MSKLNIIISEIKSILAWLIINYPGSQGNRLRVWFWSKKVHSLRTKKNTMILPNCIFHAPERITIGNNFQGGDGVIIDASDSYGIYIGDDVLVARGSLFRSANHKFDLIHIPIQAQGHKCKELFINNRKYSIIIEDDVWIATNVVILSGAKIGKGSIIGAGSVVSTEIPPYSIVIGNPSQIVSNRKKKFMDKLSDTSERAE